MNLYEIMSYKTFFYFLKDTSNLDLSGYEKYDYDEEELADLEERESLCDAFWDDMHGTDSLIEIKTNFGSVIFHKVDDDKYVQDFLTHNSKKAPCAFFGSYRTSNVYQFGLAENGKLLRYLYTDDGRTELVGEQCSLEKECDLNFEKDEDGMHLKEFLSDEDIFNMAQRFVPFDIENDDVEIVSITHYEPIEEETPQQTDANAEIVNRGFKFGLEDEIAKNMDSQQIGAFRIFLTKATGFTNLYLSSYIWHENKQVKIYSDVLKLGDQAGFVKSMAKCLNYLSIFKLNGPSNYIQSFDECASKTKIADTRASLVVELKYCRERPVAFSRFEYLTHNKKPAGKIFKFFNKQNYVVLCDDSFKKLHSNFVSKCK